MSNGSYGGTEKSRAPVIFDPQDPISAAWIPPSLLRLPAVRQIRGIVKNGSRLELPHVWIHKSSSFNDIFGTAFDVTLVCIENGTKSFGFKFE